MMRTVCVDFDGVIHAYSRGWLDGSIYDEPVPGAFHALGKLMETYAVVIHTTRDPLQVVPWLGGVHGISCCADDGEPRDFWNTPGVALVSRRKYPAVAYIDDRAIRFTDWDQALAAVTSAELREALAEADRGETVYLGSFAQYANEPDSTG